jgi:hypothetical protein
MQSGLGRRIPLRGTRDEWDQLAENLNLMLDRIEGSDAGKCRECFDLGTRPLRCFPRNSSRLANGSRRPATNQQRFLAYYNINGGVGQRHVHYIAFNDTDDALQSNQTR